MRDYFLCLFKERAVGGPTRRREESRLNIICAVTVYTPEIISKFCEAKHFIIVCSSLFLLTQNHARHAQVWKIFWLDGKIA